jgi:hypothetical protein
MSPGWSGALSGPLGGLPRKVEHPRRAGHLDAVVDVEGTEPVSGLISRRSIGYLRDWGLNLTAPKIRHGGQGPTPWIPDVLATRATGDSAEVRNSLMWDRLTSRWPATRLLLIEERSRRWSVTE